VKRAIRPIVAVIPDNRDSKLAVGVHSENFWERVSEWQRRGWAIGWHGFQHLYESTDAGIVGINKRSEFAGISRDEQLRKLRLAYEIFTRHRVQPDLWVAPAHSFDEHTVQLLSAFGVDVISDGFYARPVLARGALWIPQQLWSLRRMPCGLWTVCYHINHWSDGQLLRFGRTIDQCASGITCVADVLRLPRRAETVFDAAFSSCYRAALLLKRALAA
jgi:peptidoglycan/xylan/chitin deacetylase (PgdA/CDA1 family)